MPQEVTAKPVERTATDVMFLRTADEVEEIRRGWERLETVVGLRGRKFFGAFYPSTGEYRVCVQVKEGDDPAGGRRVCYHTEVADLLLSLDGQEVKEEAAAAFEYASPDPLPSLPPRI